VLLSGCRLRADVRPTRLPWIPGWHSSRIFLEAPMTEDNPMMVAAATVFVVADIAGSTEHYRDVLGFTVTFQYGTPTFYVCLCRDEIELHLLAAGQTNRLPGNGGICVFVRDVDAVHAELAARGARIVKPPQDYDYGMRDFDVTDLDGNQLTFGTGSAA
jgi:catechol 2,3-dioxygenase-like lactoylglutathione lyase family enzyme